MHLKCFQVHGFKKKISIYFKNTAAAAAAEHWGYIKNFGLNSLQFTIYWAIVGLIYVCAMYIFHIIQIHWNFQLLDWEKLPQFT